MQSRNSGDLDGAAGFLRKGLVQRSDFGTHFFVTGALCAGRVDGR